MALKASGLFKARSANTLRLISIPALLSLPMNALYDMSYSAFMGKLSKAGIEINRKVLADLALNNPEAFKAIVEKVK